MDREPEQISNGSAQEDLQRYHLLAQHAGLGTFELATDGTFSAIHPEACRLLEIKQAAAAQGQPLVKQIAEQFQEDCVQALKLATAGRNASFNCQIGNAEKSASTTVQLFPLKDKNGAVRSLYGLCSTSGEGRNARRLKESEQRYRQMFEFDLAIKLVVDPESGRILEANGAASRFYGYEPQEFEALTFFELSTLSRADVRAALDLAKSAPQRTSDLRHQTKGGERVDVDLFCGPMKTPDGVQLYVVIHDTHERKQRDRERDHSRERLELAVTGAAEGIWDVDILSNTMYWSDRFKALLGYAPHEINPNEMEPYGNIHPEDRGRLKQAYLDHLSERTPYDEEIRVGHSDGRYLWMHTRGQAVWDEQGQPLRMSGTFHNIHEKRLVADHLRASKDRFAFAIAGSRDGIWDWDTKTGRAWWSPRLFELLGYEDGEFPPSRERTYELMHPDDRVPTRAAADAHLADNTPFDITYRLRRKSGEYRWFRVRGQAQRDGRGAPTRFYGCFSDIDEEVHKAHAREARIARVTRQHACILELATDLNLAAGGLREACMRITQRGAETLEVGRCSVMLLEPGGTQLRSINMFRQATDSHHDGFCLDLTKLPLFFSLLQSSRVIVSSNPAQDPRFDEFPRTFISDREIKSIIEAPVRRNGKLVGVVAVSETRFERSWHEDEVDFSLNLAQQVSRLLETADVQAAKQRQFDLERQMLQNQKMESLGLMAGGVAHDFNNLLVVILGNADLLKSTFSDGSRQDDLLGEICSASKRAADLCQQMLAYSGRGHLSSTHFDLAGLVQETSHLLRISIPDQADLVRVPCPPSPHMKGDPTQVRQVVMNLILNAAEALLEGKGKITLRTGVRKITPAPQAFGLAVPCNGTYLFLEVIDTGQGMDPDTMSRIFDPFFSTKFTGRGLGMAGTLGIIRAHGGGIQVESTPGVGSRFEVCFPVAATTQDMPELQGAGAPAPWSGTGTVLLIDDDATVCNLGLQMLQRLGFEVLTASAGEQAMELYDTHQEALAFVLLDVTMPKIDGQEVHVQLQRIKRQVPILFSTGYTAKDASERLATVDVSGFLQKPYTLAELRSSIQELLA